MMELLPALSPLARPASPVRRHPRCMNILDPADGLPPADRPRVLLVEGDVAMCTMLIELLGASYQVEAVSDERAAWQTAQQDPPDLILVGLYTRGLGCLFLIKSLRANAATAMLPIVVLTASVDRELMLRCLEAGASNFLLKPFGMSDLLACVELELELHAPYGARRK